MPSSAIHLNLLVLFSVVVNSSVCCFDSVSPESTSCKSGTSIPECQGRNCSLACGGVWGDFTLPVDCASGTYYGKPDAVWYITVPSYALRPDMSNVNRHLLGSNDWLYIARFVSPIGAVASLFLPQDGGGDQKPALEIAKQQNNITGDLISLAERLTAALQLEISQRKEAGEQYRKGLLAISSEVRMVEASLETGFASVTRGLAYANAEIDASRQEQDLKLSLYHNMDIVQKNNLSPIAVKLGKIGTLGEFDPSLLLDTRCDYFEYWSTTWMYAWDKIPGGYQLYSLFSRVNVSRCPTIACYLTPGDCFYYDFSVEPLAIGKSMKSDLAVCAGTVETCTQTFLFECQNDPSCYANNSPMLKTGLEEGPQWYNLQLFSIPFMSGIEYDGSCGANKTCCGNLCIDCMHGEGFRACNPKADVLGFRMSTLWLPQGVSDTFIRSMESMGGSSLPLFYRAVREGFITEDSYFGPGKDYVAYASSFHDPIKVGKLFFPERNFSLTEKQSFLFESGNRADNIGLANYGPAVTLEVGKIPGITSPIIMNLSYTTDTSQILGWNNGDANQMGWVARDGCFRDLLGTCCLSAGSGVVVSGVRSVVLELKGLQPEDYLPRDFVMQIEVLRNFTEEFNRSDFESRLDRIDDETNQNQDHVAGIESELGVLGQRNTALGREIGRLLSLPSYSSGVPGWIVYASLIISIVSLMAVCCMCFLVWRGGGGTAGIQAIHL